MSRPFVLSLIAVAYLLSSLPSITIAQETKPAKPKIDAAAAVANRLNKRQLYDLRYKLQQGEEIHWIVEHVVSTKVQMAGETENSSSRSQTEKVWKVSKVDALGNITFVHSIASVDMWQQVGESDPVTFNSAKEKEAPEEYEGVANKIGKPLAVFTITPFGEIKDRKSALSKSSFGVGKVTIPLPGKPIAVGHQWSVATTLSATDENGTAKKLKARIRYQLARVQGHKAYIKFKTEVLTPGLSEKIKSTIMQQMTDGFIAFDIQKGRPVLKRVEWDEKAHGFEGPDSLLTYVGRMTEKIVEGKQNASTPKTPAKTTKTASTNVKLRTRDDGPVLRR